MKDLRRMMKLLIKKLFGKISHYNATNEGWLYGTREQKLFRNLAENLVSRIELFSAPVYLLKPDSSFDARFSCCVKQAM